MCVFTTVGIGWLFQIPLVPLPENDGFFFRTRDDPAVEGGAEAVGPAAVSRALDLPHFAVQDLKGMPTASCRTQGKRLTLLLPLGSI